MSRKAFPLLMIALFVVAGCTKSGDDDDDGAAPGSGGQPAMSSGSGGTPAGMAGTSAGSGGKGMTSASGGSSGGTAGTAGGSGGTTGSGGMTGSGGAETTGSGGGGEVAPPTGTEPEVVEGCDGQMLYKAPEDASAFGPWAVGVKTIHTPIGGSMLTTEIWYPAMWGSEAGKTKEEYDLRDWLPAGTNMVPDEANAPAKCDCYRDLPLDTAHGPYPAVVYIHGLGSFRVSSLSTMAMWASRGFVVVASDHPGDFITDYLASFSLGMCQATGPDPGTMQTEAEAELAALTDRSGEYAFLGDSVDTTRMGLGGHSQGGGTVAGMGGTPNVQIIITLAPLGGGDLTGSDKLKSAMEVAGQIDSVTGYSALWYNSAQTPIKRHVGIKNAGHIDVTDLCKQKNPMGKTGIEVASQYGVCGASTLALLAQCGGDPSATEEAPLIVNYATTAALEETLHCQDRSAAFGAFEAKFTNIYEFLQSP